MAVLLIARFNGSPDQLKRAYDQASKMLEAQTGSAMPPGAIRHTCALADNALYIVDIWQSEQAVRSMLESEQFEQVLTAAGFPSPRQADIQVLQVHNTIPAL